jgi:hypothetical protein
MRDPLESAVYAGALVALRNAAIRQRGVADSGTSSAGEKYPGVVIRSPEGACAVNLADDWAAIADALEVEGGR